MNEPSKYGVIVCPPNGTQILRFVEKPVEFVGDRINAGIYIFNQNILKRIPLQPTSIEQEIFPQMSKDGELQAFDLKGFWMDVGQPKDYLTGVGLYLQSLEDKNVLPKGDHIHGNVLIDASAKIGKGCSIGPNVTIGANVTIEDGVRISRAAILDGARIKSYSLITSSIVGWKSTVGKWARIENGSVLGDDVTVRDELYVNGAIILPNKSISANIRDPQVIM